MKCRSKGEYFEINRCCGTYTMAKLMTGVAVCLIFVKRHYQCHYIESVFLKVSL